MRSSGKADAAECIQVGIRILSICASEELIVMTTSIVSVAHIVELARPHLVAAKGEVINISSIAGCPMGVSKCSQN